MSDEIKNNPSLIAAGADSGNSGDNKNAQILADLKTKSFQDYDFYKQAGKTLPSGLIGNIDTFYAGIIGKLGVDSQSAAKDAKLTNTGRHGRSEPAIDQFSFFR